MSDRLDQVLKRGVLRVGTTMDTPVFSMKDASGRLHGFDMDALETLAPALGVRIEYVKMTFGSMLGDLAADKFDVAMSGMGRTYDRARTATFSKPYMRYGKLLMIRSADRDKYKSLTDLDKPGLKIAYNRGGLNDRFANTETNMRPRLVIRAMRSRPPICSQAWSMRRCRTPPLRSICGGRTRSLPRWRRRTCFIRSLSQS